VYKAKLAEQAERYEDMISAVKQVVKFSRQTGRDLTVEERNLLSVAYKNVIGARRASWRILCSIEQKGADDHGDQTRLKTIYTYRLEIEKELSDISDDILEVRFIPDASAGSCYEAPPLTPDSLTITL